VRGRSTRLRPSAVTARIPTRRNVLWRAERGAARTGAGFQNMTIVSWPHKHFFGSLHNVATALYLLCQSAAL